MDNVSHAHLSRKQLRDILEEDGYIKQVLIPQDGDYIGI